ncbi:MAG: 2-oxoacid:acceptor oxidoreductase family protein [candidate division NC10 bacterium]|nr:2-oxoacid:acceptor oxidoreductase family protein [candidate division NC10 bacterium]
MKTYDIVICGFGGQGVITLGNLLKLAGIKEGIRVSGAERRGGAQREGGVVSHVRYRLFEEGEAFDERRMTRSGLIPSGKADMLIAFEPLEAVRHCNFLHPGSVVVVNTEPSPPTLVRMKKYSYPALDDLLGTLRQFTPLIYPFNINELSRDYFHDFQHISVISLGLAVGVGEIPVSQGKFLEVLQERFPDFEGNRRGFHFGLRLGLSARNQG